jgi:peptidoglycan glycosyltransferase
MFFSTILFALIGLLLLVILIQRGGIVDSLRVLEGRWAKIALALVTLALLGTLFYRQTYYLTPERERWIVQGRTPSDSVSAGFDTKSRFRSLAQPLGRVTDRNGMLLAGYDLRSGHLRRTYPAGSTTAHLIGYWTGPVRDGVGIEKALTMLNDSLRDDRPHDARLTIDLRLQRDAMNALNGRVGAVVVIDPTNGEVLAAANYPTYNPDSVWSDSAWKRYALDEKLRPLTSRAIKDNFSPGSSIKPYVAAAAHVLNSALPEDRGFACSGTFVPGPKLPPISDHGSGHGRLDLARAMRVSCNCYFSDLAYNLVGFDPLANYLDSLGFNSRVTWNTGMFLNQYSTLLPARSWVSGHDEIAKSRIGIGQASVKINPIHEAVLLAGIANGGLFLRPTLEPGRRPDTLRWHLDAATAQWLEPLLREPLLPGGTAAAAFSGIERRGITVYGKTGTADPELDGREPSWFISYAEKNGRRYAVVVAIQNRQGQLAGTINAPIARKMYEALDGYGYFTIGQAKVLREGKGRRIEDGGSRTKDGGLR